MKPSFFSSKYPWCSVFNRAEYEIVAKNIMTILKRTGDEFRELTYEEYEKERLKDGKYSKGEQQYFERVIDFCKSADKAKKFSEKWDF
jgi:hypothetical protein